MFKNLTNNLGKILDKLRNKGHITESNIEETIREIRVALLEADVSLVVIREFLSKVKEKAIGHEVVNSISPGQMIIKIINDELIEALRSPEDQEQLNLRASPPVAILMAGLQGSGKTTSSGKLALMLKNQKKKILLVSLDIYRPAARKQLEILATKIGVDSTPIQDNESIKDILFKAKAALRTGGYDVVIYDTAGRLHIDKELIDELKYIKEEVKPSEILLSVDSLTGQDAANVGREFNEAVGITGVILTRVDGDGRGGAALSIKHVTKAPIKFIGVGEKLEAFEVFAPDRIASRILGMGDVVSLVEKAIAATDEAEMERLAKRMQSGRFDLNDYSAQLKNIQKLGGLSSIISLIPGIGKITKNINEDKISDKPIKRQIAIINSMTKQERKNPDILGAKRKKRIASGSGTDVSEINKLLKNYMQIAGFVKKSKGMDPKALMRNMKGF